jgi:hypothetical protein
VNAAGVVFSIDQSLTGSSKLDLAFELAGFELRRIQSEKLTDSSGEVLDRISLDHPAQNPAGWGRGVISMFWMTHEP